MVIVKVQRFPLLLLTFLRQVLVKAPLNAWIACHHLDFVLDATLPILVVSLEVI
jgi:hypothetical protein